MSTPAPSRSYRLTRPRRALNAIMHTLLRVGIAPPGMFLLTVRGRRSGRPYSTPVTVVTLGDVRWLVAPYGAVGWVLNARSAGRVRLARGRRSENLGIDELGDADAAPVLQAYLRKVRIVRPYFDATPGSSLSAFAAEATRHPVFRLFPLATPSGGAG